MGLRARIGGEEMSAMKAALLGAGIATEVGCPYCKGAAELVGGYVIYPHIPSLYGQKFWQCAPCGAYVGCHRPNVGYGDGTRPLGRLANAALREAKSATHALFDGLWQDGDMTRKQAYAWLSSEVGLEQAHIGDFDEETCAKAMAACERKWNELGVFGKRKMQWV